VLGGRTYTFSSWSDGGAQSHNIVAPASAQTYTATFAAGPAPFTLSATGYKVKGLQRTDLRWSGATSTNVDVFRNGTRILTTPNDGFQTDAINSKGAGSYTYKLCAAGTTTCSNQVTVTF
jgi:hypothetical protein